jgi:hypothetical protein
LAAMRHGQSTGPHRTTATRECRVL